MSTTMVMTMATPTFTSEVTTCCPKCNYDLPPLDTAQADLLVARSRVTELEAQVRLLNEKAASAADRWADYEDEIARLRGQLPSTPTPQASPPAAPVVGRASFFQSGTNRLSALLSPRRSAPNLRPETPTTSGRPMSSGNAPQTPPSGRSEESCRTEELLQALTRETNLRKEVEGRLNTTNREIEDLSATLFEQANEMVANERRARAKLEERVSELEKRDGDKRKRLDRLELAMNRIQRVRTLLAEGEEQKRITTIVDAEQKNNDGNNNNKKEQLEEPELPNETENSADDAQQQQQQQQSSTIVTTNNTTNTNTTTIT